MKTSSVDASDLEISIDATSSAWKTSDREADPATPTASHQADV
jgi:hypothetical protein